MGTKRDDTTVCKPNEKTRSFTKLLRVALTDEELIVAGDDLAREHGDLRGVNKEFDSIKANYKSKITAHESHIESLSIKIRDKFEWRPVDCVETYDYTEKKFTVTRLDTGEEIESRDLRQDELQMSITEDA